MCPSWNHVIQSLCPYIRKLIYNLTLKVLSPQNEYVHMFIVIILLFIKLKSYEQIFMYVHLLASAIHKHIYAHIYAHIYFYLQIYI
jgi:hypothetical protein